MKKILTLLMVASVFSLIACGGPTEEEKAAAEAEAAEMVEGLMGDVEEEMDEEKAEHVCGDECKEKGCTGAKCGEKGHECSGKCHAKTDEKHSCSESCNAGTHKCGAHCGCGEECGCSEGATCSAKCEIKKEEGAE